MSKKKFSSITDLDNAYYHYVKLSFIHYIKKLSSLESEDYQYKNETNDFNLFYKGQGLELDTADKKLFLAYHIIDFNDKNRKKIFVDIEYFNEIADLRHSYNNSKNHIHRKNYIESILFKMNILASSTRPFWNESLAIAKITQPFYKPYYDTLDYIYTPNTIEAFYPERNGNAPKIFFRCKAIIVSRLNAQGPINSENLYSLGVRFEQCEIKTPRIYKVAKLTPDTDQLYLFYFYNENSFIETFNMTELK
jgi:hypothetical protein